MRSGLAATVIALWCCCFAQALDPAFIKTSGYLLRNQGGNGDAVLLRGVNIGGWLVQEGWMCPTNKSGNMWEDAVERQLVGRFGVATKNSLVATYQQTWITSIDLDYMRDMGMNMVRLPFSYLTFMEDEAPSVPLNSIAWKGSAFQNIDWFIEQAKARKIYTLLDFHEVQGSAVDPGPNPNSFWAVSAYQDRAVEIWKRIAARYASEPWVVGYDLLNEPWSTAVSYYDRVIKAIRPIDPHHTIFVETWGWSNLPNLTASNWTNVVLSLHYYPGGQGRPSNSSAALQQLVDEVLLSRSSPNNNVLPIHIGEFYINGGQPENWRAMYDAFVSYNLPFNKWTWKTHFVSGWGAYNRGNVPTWGALNQSYVPNLFDPATGATDISRMWTAWNTLPYQVGDFSQLDASNRAYLSSPVASNDSISVPSSGTIVVMFSDLLQNDFSTNPDADVQIVTVKASALGSWISIPGGKVFVANVGITGLEKIPYEIIDMNNGMPGPWPGYVAVNISTPTVDSAPWGVPDRFSTVMASNLRVLSPGVLFNDGDISSRPLTAILVSQAQYGVVELSANGSFRYIPTPTFSGTDSFKYRAVAASTQSEVVTVLIDVSAPLPTNAGGLVASFYNATGFSSAFVGNRTDSTIDFEWPSGTAPLPNMSPVNFAIRWTGSICPSISGNHTITVTSDDAIRVYLNGSTTPFLDDWSAHGARDISGSIYLQATICLLIRIDFIQYGGGSVAKLSWTPPGGRKGIVPSSALVPGSIVTFPSPYEVIFNPLTPAASSNPSSAVTPSAFPSPQVGPVPLSGPVSADAVPIGHSNPTSRAPQTDSNATNQGVLLSAHAALPLFGVLCLLVGMYLM
jgi:endoglucanase